MITLEHILMGGFLPAILAAIVVAAAALWAWRRGRGGDASAAGPVAVALAYAVAFVAVKPGLPELAARQVADKLFYLAVAVGLLAAVVRGPGVPRSALLAIAAGMSAAAGVWLLRPLVPHAMSLGSLAGWVVAAAALGVVWVYSAEAVAGRIAGWTAGVWLAMLAVGCSSVIALSGSQKLGQYAGGIAAAAGAIAVLGLLERRVSTAGGAAATGATLLLATLAVAHFYAANPIPTPVGLLMLASPIAALPVLLRPLDRFPPWVRGLLAVGLSLLPLAAAIGLAALAFARASSEAAPAYSY